MKTISAGLQAIMAGNQFLIAELYTFALVGGAVLRYGDYDPNLPVLVANGHSFPTSGLKFKRTATKQALGLQVSSVELDIYADPNDATSHINGLTFQNFVRGGGLDGASVQIDRCFMSTWGDCATNGTMMWFYGVAGPATSGRTTTKLTINALTYLLNAQMPRDVYQPGCLNTLYNPSTCRLIKANFGYSGTVQAGSTATVINSNLTAQAAGLFNLGTIEFNSGANNGLVRTVKSYAAGQFSVALPLPAVPAAGDTFWAYPGCDKTMATCSGKFNNLANFRGTPFVPVPETAQ